MSETKQVIEESKQDYVLRMLNDDVFNLTEVARRTDVDRIQLIRIKTGQTKNPRFNDIMTLHDFFISLLIS